jgi:hypothetical protein
MTARRELQLAVLLCLLGSALVLFALSRTWYSVAEGQQLTIDAVHTPVRGTHVVAGAQALGWVGLAGVVALAATKRWGRVVIGVLVLAAGVGIVVDVAQARVPYAASGWAWLTVAGGVVLALSGVLVAVRGRKWAALSPSYDAPALRSDEPPATDKAVWDALDRGEDPTT